MPSRAYDRGQAYAIGRADRPHRQRKGVSWDRQQRKAGSCAASTSVEPGLDVWRLSGGGERPGSRSLLDRRGGLEVFPNFDAGIPVGETKALGSLIRVVWATPGSRSASGGKRTA